MPSAGLVPVVRSGFSVAHEDAQKIRKAPAAIFGIGFIESSNPYPSAPFIRCGAKA